MCLDINVGEIEYNNVCVCVYRSCHTGTSSVLRSERLPIDSTVVDIKSRSAAVVYLAIDKSVIIL